MNRSELVEIIAIEHGLSRQIVDAVLSTFCGTVVEAAKRGESVLITGFGTFKVVERKARSGRHPRTGQPMTIEPAILPQFTPSPNFKLTVDGTSRRAR